MYHFHSLLFNCHDSMWEEWNARSTCRLGCTLFKQAYVQKYFHDLHQFRLQSYSLPFDMLDEIQVLDLEVHGDPLLSYLRHWRRICSRKRYLATLHKLVDTIQARDMAEECRTEIWERYYTSIAPSAIL